MMKRVLSFVLAFIMIASIGLYADATTIDDVKKQQQLLSKELKELEAAKKKEKQNLINNKQYLSNLKTDLQKKGYEKALIEDKIEEILSAIETLNQAIVNAEKEYDEQLKLFQERLVVAYVRSRTGADLSEISDCNDINELFKRIHMMKLVSKLDQELMDSLVRKKQEIEELKLQREDEEANFEAQLEKSLEELKQLEVSRSQAEQRVVQTQKSLAQIEKEEDQLEKEAQELTALIKKLSSSGAYQGGIMKWPLPGYTRIGSPFGYRIHPILKVRKFHGGIDIGAPSGTYIHAAATGKVICSGWRSGGSGNTIIIDHGGGITTLYFHIKSKGLLVKEGQVVKAGDVIARVGSTGLSTGPHLHFEVRKNGDRQDPLKYVKPGK